jgi:hypothetical protein
MVQLRLTSIQPILVNGAGRPKKGRGLSGKEKALMKALGQ